MKPGADPLGRPGVQRLPLDSHLAADVSSHAGVRTSSAWLAAQIAEKGKEKHTHSDIFIYILFRSERLFLVPFLSKLEKIRHLVAGFKAHFFSILKLTF